ncbi:MAG: MT-A70 family methyltransferase [Methylobacter sp.]|nr:MT-A70 family methyltransferase [Methylobacter sp.]
MRQYCLGAILLDIEDPRKIFARLKKPSMTQYETELDRYILNVLYSCGDYAAAKAGINPHYVSDGKRLKEYYPALFEQIKAGLKTFAQALREIKRQFVIDSLESIAGNELKQTQGVYDVIVIDPPWPMQKIERDVRVNQVALDYPTMTLDEIAVLDLPCATPCHVWLWTTHKFLRLDRINLLALPGFDGC